MKRSGVRGRVFRRQPRVAGDERGEPTLTFNEQARLVTGAGRDKGKYVTQISCFEAFSVSAAELG